MEAAAGPQTIVLEKLEELQGWAEYVFEALLGAQDGRPFKVAGLEGLVPKHALEEVRWLSWSLRDKHYVMRTELEYGAVADRSPRQH